MTKKLTPAKAIKLAAVKAKAKKKAEERNRGGAIVTDLDKPEGQYTKQIICVECGKPRKVKPQDAWQVKRCVDCQNKKKGATLEKLIERKSSPTAQKEERAKKGHAKLDAWVKDNNEQVERFARYRMRLEEEEAKNPKLKRIWPK